MKIFDVNIEQSGTYLCTKKNILPELIKIKI